MALRKPVIADSTQHKPLPASDQLFGNTIQLSTDAGNTIALGTDGGLMAVGGGSGGSAPSSIILIAMAGTNGYGSDTSQAWPVGPSFEMPIPVLGEDLTPYSHIFVDAQVSVAPENNATTITANQGVMLSVGIYQNATGGQFYALPYLSTEVVALKPKEAGSQGGSVNLSSNTVDLSTVTIDPTIPLVFNINASGVNLSTQATMNPTIPLRIFYRWKLYGVTK